MKFNKKPYIELAKQLKLNQKEVQKAFDDFVDERQYQGNPDVSDANSSLVSVSAGTDTIE